MDARELIDRHAVAFATLDWDMVKEYWHPDAEVISPHGSRPVSDMAAIMAEIDRDEVDVTIEVSDAFASADGRRIALEWTYASTNRADGRRTSSPDAIMIDLRDGLIYRWREYFDRAIPSEPAADQSASDAPADAA